MLELLVLQESVNALKEQPLTEYRNEDPIEETVEAS